MIEMVELNHNQKMLESPDMLLHKRSHKKDDPLIDQLVKDMQLDNHTHTHSDDVNAAAYVRWSAVHGKY